MSNEIAEITMTVSPEMEKELVELFDISIEVMQGNRKELPDGRCEIKISVANYQKQEMIKEFVLNAISKSHTNNKN